MRFSGSSGLSASMVRLVSALLWFVTAYSTGIWDSPHLFSGSSSCGIHSGGFVSFTHYRDLSRHFSSLFSGIFSRLLWISDCADSVFASLVVYLGFQHPGLASLAVDVGSRCQLQTSSFDVSGSSLAFGFL
ncbi:hypothetical protein U1Q18_004880 [Sarracenia purpurea var. burkii]